MILHRPSMHPVQSQAKTGLIYGLSIVGQGPSRVLCMFPAQCTEYAWWSGMSKPEKTHRLVLVPVNIQSSANCPNLHFCLDIFSPEYCALKLGFQNGYRLVVGEEGRGAKRWHWKILDPSELPKYFWNSDGSKIHLSFRSIWVIGFGLVHYKVEIVAGIWIYSQVRNWDTSKV